MGICALLIPTIVFVSLSHQKRLPPWSSHESSEAFCELLRCEFYSLRTNYAVSECALGFGQAGQDRFEAAILGTVSASCLYSSLAAWFGAHTHHLNLYPVIPTGRPVYGLVVYTFLTG